MFFGDLIRRRLASLIRPWLMEDPSLVLDLGLVNSRATATNLTLDVAAINRLLRDGDADSAADRFVFEEVTVERVSLRFSNWSVPAFDIEIRGVSVTLAAKALDEEEDRSRRKRRSTKVVEEEENRGRKKALAKLDPAGSSLHDVLEKMVEATPARNPIATSLLNLILGQSCLRVSDLHLRLQIPVPHNSLVWSFELKKLRATSQSSSRGCLIRGFLGAVLLSVKQASFVVDFEGFEVAYELSDRANQILNPSDMLTCVKSKDMRVTELIIRVPPLNVQLSPIDLPVVLVLGDLFSRPSKHVRDGKQLWKLTARRLGNIISSPRLSFHNVVESVCQWLQYLCAYEDLLSLLGYPADVLLKSSVAVTISDRMPASNIKHKWKVISTLEKELPFEAIAQARRVARYRAGLDVRGADGRHEDPLMRSSHTVLFKILFLLGSFFFYWNLLGYFWPWSSLWIIFLSASYLVVLICILWGFQTDRHSKVVSEQSHYSILLNFTKIVISVSPTKAAQDVSGKLEWFTGFPYENMCWFCLTLETILIASINGDFEQSMLVSCGSLNMKSYLVGASSSETSSSYSLGSRRRRLGSSTTVLWSEPALMSLSSLARETSRTGQPEGPGRPDLNVLLEETWLAWNKVTAQYQSAKIEYSENPWLLCEIKSSSKYDDMSQEKLDSGFWQCHLASGKLNSALRYSSIVSLAMLLGQMQHILRCLEVHDTTNSHEYAPPMEGQVTLNSNDDDEPFTAKVNRLLFGLFPDRYVQLALFIVGPQVRISLNGDGLDERNRKMDHVTTHSDFLIGFGIQDIEVVILPTSRSDLKLSEGAGLEGAEFPRSGESREVERPKIDNQTFTSRSFISLQSYVRANGLVIYLRERLENKIIVLKPITIQLSSFRESVHSFTSTSIGLSTTVFGVAAGLEVILFMDELYAFSQAVAGLSSVASNAFGVGLVGFEQFLDSMQQIRAPTSQNDALDNKVEGSLIGHDSAILPTSSAFDCKSIDIIVLHAGVFDKVDSSFKEHDALIGQKCAGNELPDCGFLIHLERSTVEVTHEEGFLGLICNFSDLRSLLFRYQYYYGESFDSDAVRNLLQQSEDCLYEILLSTLVLTLCLGQTSSSEDSRGIHTLVNRPSFRFETSEGSSTAQFARFVQKFGFSSDMDLPSSSLQVLINIAAAEILVVSCSVKDSLLGVRQTNKLTSLTVIGGSIQSFYWAIQGGLFCLETTALMIFSRCISLYLCCLKDLSSIMGECLLQAERVQPKDQITLRAAEMPKWKLPEVSKIQLSQFSLAFILEDDSGIFRELILEVDACFKLESANMERILIFDLSRLSFISHLLDKCRETKDQAPHHPLVIPDESPSLGPSQDPDVSVQRCHISYQNHILSHVVVSVSVQKLEHAPFYLNGVWAGHGSVSGFDLIISVTEIKLILSLISSLPASSIKETTPKLRAEELPADEDAGSSFNDLVPDGAIVAIQDVHQHVYFAVEGEETKYTSSSVIHYSLVGDKALFRVKHHLQKTWNLPVLWISLTSLHAENKSGEPPKLRYQPGSGFVDISSSKDNGFSLWRTLPCSPGNDKSGIDWECSNKMVKDTFYLVNKKNDCGVAFTDGIPEFVKKPGNPFKFKVLHCQALARDITRLDGDSLTNYAGRQSSTNGDEELISQQVTSLPCIHIAVENVSLTIVHELLDTRDTLPLLRCAINVSQLSAQIMSHKRRLICEARVGLHYFDAGRYLWRELIYPVDLHIFHSKKYEIRRSEIIDRGIPVHTHIRVKEFSMTLTEHSLDVLLFIIGELNLAGPFSVRSSLILANCCKVENQSGLNVLCHFYNEKVVTIPREQSASVFLRYVAQENQEAESFSNIAIQLSNSGSFATSPLKFSLLKSQALAWRTRIMSVEGSRTYPGPVVVVDIARKTEDGVSVVVTPLVRIHNVTEFSLELQFRRQQQTEDAYASVLLKRGDFIDDSMAVFDAISLSGPEKKTLMSLAIGNFLLSFRPEIDSSQINLRSELSIEWSDELKGGKAVQLSGIFNKLSYKVRRALGADSVKCSFSTACCAIRSENAHIVNLHFLIQSISREVPILPPDSSRDSSETGSSIALLEQKEIFLLPTVRVSNFLHSEISVLLSETDTLPATGGCKIGKEATISHGSTADYYANPRIMYFTATLITPKRSCKPVSSTEWMKKLKNKISTQSINIELDFGGGIFASLGLSRGVQGVLEAVIYTPYSLKNDSDVSFFVFGPNQKPPMSRDEMGKSSSSFSSDLGLILATNSVRSWFSRSHKIQLKVLEDCASPALLDLGSLSGPTEISLETEEIPGNRYIRKFGISSGPFINRVMVPSHMVTIGLRHVLFNDSEESITVRQYDCENETAGMINVDGKQRATLKLQNRISKSREFSLFENIIRKHRNDTDTRSVPIQFRLNKPNSGWSGPVCTASLGRFFLKFRKTSYQQAPADSLMEFAVVHVVEEGSTLGVRFQKPPNIDLPYLLENHLSNTPFTYYQKDSSEREVLQSDCHANYVWDDSTLPHKLVVVIDDMHVLREINLDKVRSWKPFLRSARGLVSYSLLDRRSKEQKASGKVKSTEIMDVGYEVYAEGPTRVLRICDFSQSQKGKRLFESQSKLWLRVQRFTIHLLEQGKQDLDEKEEPSYVPILDARLGNINLDCLSTDQQRYNMISVQSINVDHKWLGAPFVSMLRVHHSDLSDSNSEGLRVVVVILSSSSNVRQVKYSSIVLQPVDLNLDEETLMRVASFWRTSLSNSNTPSQQYYFDHFEIHPIKIVANFLPGEAYSSYNSSQEMLRSLLHSVIKIPPMKNVVVELNGVLVTHALITLRDLVVRCAKHYSWYTMRGIYIAKGSTLLPPAFASMFDDLSSSSLDVFFDPSTGLINLSGATIGTFKFLRTCIDGKGFSGTKRYFGDLGKSLRTVGSNVLFAAITEVSDSVLIGAQTNGFDGMVNGFHHGILKLAMEPAVIGTALMGGGPDRKIKLDRSPGVDELYIEGYLQAMLDCFYRQEYLRVRLIDDQVVLKNLPPNSALISEIMDRVKEFLVSRALLKGDPSASLSNLRHLHAEREWKIGPTVITLFEHLFVSFAIRMLRKQTSKVLSNLHVNYQAVGNVDNGEKHDDRELVPADARKQDNKVSFVWKWGIGKFVFSGILAYIDGRLCRCIPNPVARRIVSGYLLSFLDRSDNKN